MTAETKPILARVAQILDEYSVILDKGAKDGVKRGMRFVIFGEGGELTDTEGKSLGILEIPKGEVSIIHVMEHMSIGESKEVKTTSLIPAYTTFTTHVPLPVEKKDIAPRKFDPTVRKGDKARQIE